ncbi:MAG: putative oxidoreductase, partial [Chloroflexi bacterium OLB15]
MTARLGSIYYAKSYWMRRRGVPAWGGWFAQHELAGGGPMIDLGVHMLDMAL